MNAHVDHFTLHCFFLSVLKQQPLRFRVQPPDIHVHISQNGEGQSGLRVKGGDIADAIVGTLLPGAEDPAVFLPQPHAESSGKGIFSILFSHVRMGQKHFPVYGAFAHMPPEAVQILHRGIGPAVCRTDGRKGIDVLLQFTVLPAKIPLCKPSVRILFCREKAVLHTERPKKFPLL